MALAGCCKYMPLKLQVARLVCVHHRQLQGQTGNHELPQQHLSEVSHV